MSLEVQLLTAVAMIVTGILLATGFDLWQASGQLWHYPPWVVWLGDLLFWPLGALATFWVLLQLNGGQLRFYFLGFLGAGFLFSYLFLHRRMVKLYQGMLSLIWGIFKQSLLLLYQVLLFPLKILYTIILAIVGVLGWIFVPVFKLLVTPLCWFGGRLWDWLKTRGWFKRWLNWWFGKDDQG